MSRHHIQPPIIYTPPPPKPRETRRRRPVLGTGSSDEAAEAEETVDIQSAGASPGPSALPPHTRPVEAVERRNPSATGRLSEDTLKTLLQAQEQEQDRE